MSLFLLISLIWVITPSYSQDVLEGRWGGTIAYKQIEVPMEFEISNDGEDFILTLVNGDERIPSRIDFTDQNKISVNLEPFDVTINAVVEEGVMEGEYIKHYRNARMDFKAMHNAPRIAAKQMDNYAEIEPTLEITFNYDRNSSSPAVGLFEQSDNRVTGTILTEVGDYRFFDGIVDGDSLKVSSFDGAHAFYLLGKKEGNEWKGIFHQDNAYTETWIGKPNKKAKLDHPFKTVRVKDQQPPYFDILGAGSGKNAINPSNYQGKVVVIQLFGTWCPNSYDETNYLVKWKEENPEKNVAILASSYETNYSKKYGLERIEEYKADMNIPYEVVLGGRLNKQQAAMAFPFMQRINAFPTLVFLDKQGNARYVHEYFMGPATGIHYLEFDQRFNEIIDELLAE